MSDWRYRLAEHRGTLLALAFFILMFAIYASNHPAGFTANVVQTAANKGALLALVAMAQTFVVLTAGIDLSVGMVFVLTNCLASWIVVGSPAMVGLGVVGVLLTGLLCGAINGAIVIYGRLQPIVTTIATGAIYFGIALALRPVPGGDVNSDLADAFTGRVLGVIPASLVALAAVVVVIWLPYRRSVIGRAAYAVGSSESRRLYVGRAGPRGKILRLCHVRADRVDGRPVPHLHHLFGRSLGGERRLLHALFDRRRRSWRRVACSAARAARSARSSAR